jgi:hypothetical protein
MEYGPGDQDLAAEIIRTHEQLASNRGNWESQWEQIGRRVIPSMSGNFNAKNNFQSDGQPKTEDLYDSTASVALERFAAIMDSLLTPRNQTWHRLAVNNRTLAKDRNVKLYFEEANRILFKFRYAPEANFSAQNQQNFLSLGAFGTGCVFTDKLTQNVGLRYRAVHLGEICFAENHQGMIDQAYRYFPLTARQAVQKWPDKVPARIKDAIKTNAETKFYFIHCVKPRSDVDPNRADYKGMAFSSHYVSIENQEIMEEGGFSSFPYAISRYFQSLGEVYGRSPAMSVLPAIKTLNEEKKTILKQGHRVVDPVLLAFDDGVLDSFSLRPGAVNYGGVSADGRALVQALPTGNIAVGKELMDDERAIINDSFLVKIFQILVESPQMTATEVMERAKEKGMLLAPTVGRQQSEYLGSMIPRELDVLAAQSLLPPMPEILKEARGEFEIMYDSPLSRAQRAEEGSGLMRTVETVLNVVNVTQNQEPLDHFNWDTIIPEIAEIQGVPARWMRSVQDVMNIRGGRAQKAQQDQMVQAAPGAAAMVNALSKSRKTV